MQECANLPAQLAALQRVHAQPVVDIVDESDAYLDSRVQLIYAFGAKEALPHCEVRCEVVAELLHALSCSVEAHAILADPQVAEVLRPWRRWGAGMDVRLVQGVQLLLLPCRALRSGSKATA